MTLREIKQQAREDLHEAMRVFAYYMPTGAAPHVELHPRVHTEFAALGDIKGTSFAYAERQDTTPVLIFWRDELTAQGATLVRNAVVTVDEEEGYRLDHIHPPDHQTVKATVTRMKPVDVAALPHP